jgi:hypothetical protein
MKATEKFYNEMNKTNSTSWLNIAMGNNLGAIEEGDIYQYGVTLETFRAQLRKEFYTRMIGETLYFAKQKINTY